MIIRSCLICISLCATFLTKAQTGELAQIGGLVQTGGLAADRSGPSGTVSRADILVADTTEGLRLADSLYGRGEYFEASIAYERVLFDNGDKQALFHAVLGKAQCLKKQKLFDQAVTFLEAYQAFPFPDSSLGQIHYQQVLCTYLGGHFENTISLVDRWPYTHGGRQPGPLLSVLKILSLNELQRWKEAEEAYLAFVGSKAGGAGGTRIGGAGGTEAAGVSAGAAGTGGSGIGASGIVGAGIAGAGGDPYTNLPHFKSVNKAQWLSTFIPGGGQFYAGKPLEGIFSVLVQAAGVWFAVVSFEQHYYISAWLVGAAIFGAFHMGGVRRAEVLVQQYNRKKMLKFNEEVRTELLRGLE